MERYVMCHTSGGKVNASFAAAEREKAGEPLF